MRIGLQEPFYFRAMKKDERKGGPSFSGYPGDSALLAKGLHQPFWDLSKDQVVGVRVAIPLPLVDVGT